MPFYTLNQNRRSSIKSHDLWTHRMVWEAGSCCAQIQTSNVWVYRKLQNSTRSLSECEHEVKDNGPPPIPASFCGVIVVCRNRWESEQRTGTICINALILWSDLTLNVRERAATKWTHGITAGQVLRFFVLLAVDRRCIRLRQFQVSFLCSLQPPSTQHVSFCSFCLQKEADHTKKPPNAFLLLQKKQRSKVTASEVGAVCWWMVSSNISLFFIHWSSRPIIWELQSTGRKDAFAFLCMILFLLLDVP